jgi:hypothetical protein
MMTDTDELRHVVAAALADGHEPIEDEYDAADAVLTALARAGVTWGSATPTGDDDG